MKKILMVGFLIVLMNRVVAVPLEKIDIVKPLVTLVETKIPSTDYGNGIPPLPPMSGANVVAKVTGYFQSTFPSKDSCLAWAKKTIVIVKSSQKIIFSASCSNQDLAPAFLEVGHFVGFVAYL
ncbi:MAG: hypothetical protein QE271_00280 [Bacteriovoracaceae bacterium]|nr:hypothetical protein [Bacteriovoracaceae bacterium]